MADESVNKTVDQVSETNTSENIPGEDENQPETDQEKSLATFEQNNFTALDNLKNSSLKVTENLQNNLRDAVQQGTLKQNKSNKTGPGPLPSRGREVSDIIEHLQGLVTAGLDGTESITTVTNVPRFDSLAQTTLVSHSISAWLCTLKSNCLRKLASHIVSDTGLWVSRLFRFFDSSAFFHEDAREGLVRVCRLVLNHRYPKFGTDGYEALYPRPPVIYMSAAGKPGLGNYVCSQLGLPVSCLSIVPCVMVGAQSRMDLGALTRLVADDVAAQRVPLLIVANAGSPVVGHMDSLQKVLEICRSHEMWLHIEGNSLAALTMLSTPNLPAKIGDSLLLPLGTWLGIPSVPYVTIYKNMDPALTHSAGLTSVNVHVKLNCVPLWVGLQMIGQDGVTSRIRTAFELSKYMQDKICQVGNIRQLGRQKSDMKDVTQYSVGDLMAKSVSSALLFEILSPTTVFQYVQNETQISIPLEGEESHIVHKNSSYFDCLNTWLGQVIQRDVPNVGVDIVELDQYGISLRFCPLENAFALGTQKEDIDDFINIFTQQVSILNATVTNKEEFNRVIEQSAGLQGIEIAHWAGLGGVRYIPETLVDQLRDLPDSGKEEVNQINRELVAHLRSLDSAFSLGEGVDGLLCIRFGMVTHEADLRSMLGMVEQIGREIEESSKFLESMGEVIKKGIETANEDLKKENDDRIWQEGLLRHVPIVGSFYNWWAPLPKETGIKGRSFDLSSGLVESTENTYKYHMQINRESPNASVPPTPKPQVRTPVTVQTVSHSRSSSKGSAGSGGALISPASIVKSLQQQLEPSGGDNQPTDDQQLPD